MPLQFRFKQTDLVFVGQGTCALPVVEAVRASGAFAFFTVPQAEWRGVLPAEHSFAVDYEEAVRTLLRCAGPAGARAFVIGEIAHDSVVFRLYAAGPVAEGVLIRDLAHASLAELCADIRLVPTSLLAAMPRISADWQALGPMVGSLNVGERIEASLQLAQCRRTVRCDRNLLRLEAFLERRGDASLIMDRLQSDYETLLLCPLVGRPFDTAFIDVDLIKDSYAAGIRRIIVAGSVRIIGSEDVGALCRELALGLYRVRDVFRFSF